MVAIFFWKCALWEFLHGVAAWFASDLKEKKKKKKKKDLWFLKFVSHNIEGDVGW